MAWLFFDTHEPDRFRFGWLGCGGRMYYGHGRAHKLLVRLGSAWSRRPAMDGVCVVAGPGSFSAIRLGVLYANLFARLLGKPLVGVSVRDALDAQTLQKKLEEGVGKLSAYVAPLYDAEPNITYDKNPLGTML